jgi:hypothetical protein
LFEKIGTPSKNSAEEKNHSDKNLPTKNKQCLKDRQKLQTMFKIIFSPADKFLNFFFFILYYIKIVKEL